MGHFGPKIAHPHNCGTAGRTFLKFCTMKSANRQMIMILKIFKKKHLVQMDHFGPQNGTSS